MKHEIDIPDLPEGWEPVAYRYAHSNEYVLSDGNIEQIRQSIIETSTKRLIVRKKQTRRIVLEETGETNHSFWDNSIHFDDIIINIDSKKQWKIVEDNK